MPDLIERALTHADMEIRGDGRTVYGLAVPFDRESVVDDGYGKYREVFRHGAFTRTINGGVKRVKLYVNHSHRRGGEGVGVAHELREDRAGLVGEFRVVETPDGDSALAKVRAGVFDAFSVGFAEVPGKDRKTRDLVERLEVKLREVSLVSFPAYEDAVISGVRSLESDDFIRHLLNLDADEAIEEFRKIGVAAERAVQILGTQRTELASGTSPVDPPVIPSDPVVGHSPRTRAQRTGAALIQGAINGQSAFGDPRTSG